MSARYVSSSSLSRMAALVVVVVVGSIVTTSSVARADNPPAEVIAAPPERANSINVSPLGVVFGSYSLNYERLFDGTHGLVVEGSFAHAADDDNSSNSFGGSVGYRWHWRGSQNSGFLGVNAGFFRGTGEGSISDGGPEKSFDLDIKSYSLTANVGKRWAWDNGLNVTFRIGVGYGNYDISTDSTDPDAQEVVENVDDLLTLLPVALDGELSVGYAF